jgi:acetyltransferase-like isoleucine patch superfamily enzyme
MCLNLPEEWIKPEFNEFGMTQWYWRVVNHENFTLGDKVEIGSFSVIDAKYGVEIQDNVKIGWNCTIMSNSSIDGKKGKVVLEKNCNIGANSVVFPNVKIGRNAVIGANSLVNCDIPAEEVWIGSPAKKLR